jgi:hypothetical protein
MAKQHWWYPSPHEFDEKIYGPQNNPWDNCTLGGFDLPGISKVSVSKERKVDVKEAQGVDGATITDKGTRAADVRIRTTIWTPSQWEDMQIIVPQLEPEGVKGDTKSVLKNVVAIINPAAQSRNVNSVYVKAIEGPTDGSVPGTKEYQFTCLGWNRPPKSGSVTKTAKQAVTPRANDLAEKPPTDPATQKPTPW